jgi:hypothetical protein
VASAAAGPADALVPVRKLPGFAGWPGRGLVTSWLPISRTVYRGFGVPSRAPGIFGAARWRAALKGVLVTRLARPDLCVLNTHPVANRDGDWSRAGRFYPLHRAHRCGPDEWYVCVEVRELATLEGGSRAPDGTADKDLSFPCCFRGASEIRCVSARSGPHRLCRAARRIPAGGWRQGSATGSGGPRYTPVLRHAVF